MKSFYIEAGNLKALNAAFQQLESDDSTQSILVFMASKERFNADQISPLLQASSKRIIGGVFPELIFQGEQKTKGVLIICLEHIVDCQRFDLEQNSNHFFRILNEKFNTFGANASSLFVFCDNLGKDNSAFLETLYNFFGVNLKYIGGAAGSEEFESFPCIIDNEGIHQNAAIIGLSNLNIRIGVAHGLSAISPPLKVTQAVGNRIKTIDWQPAFSVYKKVVEEHSGQLITTDNFWDIVQFYPLGLARMDEERILRDLRCIEDTDLLSINLIHQGEHICVMHANTNALLEGAQRARDLVYKRGLESEQIFCINCISRSTFLQENFNKEIEIIGPKEKVNGVLTMGEIASTGYVMPEIFNKTIVVARW